MSLFYYTFGFNFFMEFMMAGKTQDYLFLFY